MLIRSHVFVLTRGQRQIFGKICGWEFRSADNAGGVPVVRLASHPIGLQLHINIYRALLHILRFIQDAAARLKDWNRASTYCINHAPLFNGFCVQYPCPRRRQRPLFCNSCSCFPPDPNVRIFLIIIFFPIPSKAIIQTGCRLKP